MFNFNDFFGNYESNLYSQVLLNDNGFFINTGDNIDIERIAYKRPALNKVKQEICCDSC